MRARTAALFSIGRTTPAPPFTSIGRTHRAAAMNDNPDLDLPAYCRRIGFDGPLAPSRETLAALIGHHAAAIPFENIDVLAGRVPQLDLQALQHKLVQRRRGGYCFEQNGLLLACLRQAGFDVQMLEARVRAGLAPEVVTGRTHLALRVAIEGEHFLADVGFGGLGPLAPLRLAEIAAQATPGGAYRLSALGEGDRLLQMEGESGWSDCYRIVAGTPQPVDCEIGNWYVATHPKAMMKNNLLVARALPGGGRLTLFNRQLTRRPSDPRLPLQEQTLDNRAELADVLADGFALEVNAAEIDAVLTTFERQAAARDAA